VTLVVVVPRNFGFVTNRAIRAISRGTRVPPPASLS
jgi:hypothetical protein